MKMKLQNKFIFMILPILLASTFIVSLIIYDYIQNMMVENTDEQTRTQLNMFLQSIDKNTEKSLEQYRFISNTNAVRDYITSSGQTKSLFTQKDMMALFAGIYETNNGFKEIYIFDADGKINFVYSNDKMYDHREDNAWLNSLIQESNRDSIISIENTSNGYRLAYTIQILNASSSVIGYLVGTESFDFIQPWMNLSENKNLTGSLLIHGNNLIEKSGQFNTTALMHHYKQFDSNNLNSSNVLKVETGDTGNVLYVQKGQYGIIAGVIVNNQAYLAVQNYLLKITLGIAAFLSIFLFFTIYTSFRKLIIKRLELIEDASKKIAMGNHNISLPTNQRDEIGNLFKTINQMSHDIATGHEKIHDLAYYDELTRLHNKASFNMALKRMIALCDSNSDTEVAFLSIDLDDFKSINDLHGHHTGDHFLKIVAARLRDLSIAIEKEDLRKNEIFVSRLAGDEFAVLIYGKNIKSFANNLSNRIISSIREQMSFYNTEIYPSCSIGISLYPTQAENEIELVKYSDIAMYEAKRLGKNQAMPFETGMIERVIKKEEICNNIKIALEHDSFELYLQPKFNVKKQCFNKFESLIRWIDPVKGFISPGVFIPIAESSNLIVEIGDWVLKQTCKNIRTMESKGWKNFCVSFNVSPQQLLDSNFSRNIERNISIFNIDPSHLEIEVTETSCAENIDFVTKELDVIRRMGVTVALDDFGTGYSSLSYLKDFPLDVIKLDRAFVSKALESEIDMTIIKSVMNIAEVLNIKTVAEGVETAEESKLMQSIGVDYIQGFYFYKPLPMADILAEDFSKRLEEIGQNEEKSSPKALSIA